MSFFFYHLHVEKTSQLGCVVGIITHLLMLLFYHYIFLVKMKFVNELGHCSAQACGNPLLFHDQCSGFFYEHNQTQYTGPTAKYPRSKDKSIMVKYLSQGHICTSAEFLSVVTGCRASQFCLTHKFEFFDHLIHQPRETLILIHNNNKNPIL